MRWKERRISDLCKDGNLGEEVGAGVTTPGQFVASRSEIGKGGIRGNGRKLISVRILMHAKTVLYLVDVHTRE